MNACPAPTSPDSFLAETAPTDRLIVLPNNRIFAVEAGDAGVALHCVDGDAWVTQAGCADDFVVTAGDTFVTPRAGKVVVQSVGHVRLRVEETAADPLVLRAARPALIAGNRGADSRN